MKGSWNTGFIPSQKGKGMLSKSATFWVTKDILTGLTLNRRRKLDIKVEFITFYRIEPNAKVKETIQKGNERGKESAS